MISTNGAGGWWMVTIMCAMLAALPLCVSSFTTNRAWRFDHSSVRQQVGQHKPWDPTRMKLLGHNLANNAWDLVEMADASQLRSRRNMFQIGVTATLIALSTACQSAQASTTDPKTGILLPSEGEIETSIPLVWDDSEDGNPFASMGRDKFSRLDMTPDGVFYNDPRFVEHVDENAVQKMTRWTSHIDPSVVAKDLTRVAGLGMNEKELTANPSLTEWTIRDLNANKDTKLPYETSSFDAVLCQLSIDYLVHPLEVMKEVGRVLKPGGRVAILFSNRLFLSKAVGLWTGADDIDHAYTVGSYLHYSFGGFEDIKAEDLSTRKGNGKNKPIVGDPIYVVTAKKAI
eukprot:scaffold441080_cov63-Attheya_sp.AAC.1